MLCCCHTIPVGKTGLCQTSPAASSSSQTIEIVGKEDDTTSDTGPVSEKMRINSKY